MTKTKKNKIKPKYRIEDYLNDESTIVFDKILFQNDELFYGDIIFLKELILSDFTNQKSKIVDVDFGDGIYEITQGNLLTFLILAIPFHKHQISFEGFEFEIDGTNALNSYMDRIIKYFKDVYDISINDELIDIISELSKLTSMILGVFAITINLYDLCKLINTNDEFNELMQFKLENVTAKNLDFKKSLDLINNKFSKLLDILKIEDTCYKVLLLSKSGVNEKQFKDTYFNVGFKPNTDGSIINIPADTSYVRGNDPVTYYIDCVGGRKALLINYKNTKDSGYLTRKLTILVVDNYIANDVDDCGTKQTISAYIANQKTLDKLIYRNYYDKKGKLRTINPEKDKHLIGQTIQIRSPIKCALNDNRICKKCYGELWKYNIGKNVGIIASLILNNQNTQTQLSAKHNLQANLSEIKWGEDFGRYFIVDKEKITLNEKYCENKKFNILIPEFQESDIFDGSYIFDKMIIEEFKKEPVTINLPKNFIVNEDVILDIEDKYKESKEAYVINCGDISSDDILFTYSIQNNEMSASLNNIINLIETHSFIKDNDIDAIYNRFISLLNDSPLIIHLVHIEIILKELCKIDCDDRSLFKTPKKEGSDYPIIDVMRVTDAIIKGPYVSKSYVYQEQTKQLTQMPETYYKTRPSVIDGLIE